MLSSHIVLGILADVDAGKTTLSENILFRMGSIRKKGRVDHGDTCLDYNAMEKERGITIFSSQARFTAGDKNFTLLDTPGHVDFSAETERTLSVLDYAVMLISAPEGVRSHVLTIWKLLKRYRIPVFVFINKTDLVSPETKEIIAEMNKKLGPGFIKSEELYTEEAALLDDDATEKYLENGTLEISDIQRMIADGKLFPCYSGSALKDDGIAELIHGIETLTLCREYSDVNSARVFKITRDRNDRLSHIKVTGGKIRVKDVFGENKIEQIRLYNGLSCRTVQEAFPGMIVAVTGLSESYAGQGLGDEKDCGYPLLVPLFSMTVIPTYDVSGAELYEKLKELEEEIPELSVDPYTRSGDVRIRLMGAVQTEVISRIMSERFQMPVRFGNNRIVYRETVTRASEGVGHFEPLRHYAEVHLLLEPGEPGSGMSYCSELSEDLLPGNYQRLILSMLERRTHKGVLTGSALTDVKVTLVAGKHHIKHTVGGDFREAACRAVRHGLMLNSCKVLEPWYSFEIALPSENAGRAMSDITCRLSGKLESTETSGENTVITGKAPVATIRNYQEELTAYTKGYGHMNVFFCGYLDCHNEDEVIASEGYDATADLKNPAGSVFCEHGAGLYVEWPQVEEHMHLMFATEAGKKYGTTGSVHPDLLQKIPGQFLREEADPERKENVSHGNGLLKKNGTDYLGAGIAADKELEKIFLESLSRNRKEDTDTNRAATAQKKIFTPAHVPVPEPKLDFLLVDGYNIIHAWKELSQLASADLNSARSALLDILANFQAFRSMTLIVVFDAYKVAGGKGSVGKYAGIYCVYTKEAETADAYIEKTVHEIGRKHNVTVATSDGLEQIIVFGEGAVRMSAADLLMEVKNCSTDIEAICRKKSERLENRIPLKVSDEKDNPICYDE